MCSEELRPAVTGLSALYKMQDFFLNNMLQQYTIKQLMEDNSIESFDNMSNLADNWQSWIVHYVGLLLAIGAGFLLVVIIPCRGCCFCCCSKKNSKNPPKPSACKACFCCLALLVVMAVMVSMAALLFILASQVDMELQGKKMTKDVNCGIEKIDDFVNHSAYEFTSHLDDQFDAFESNINVTLYQLGTDIVRQVEIEVGLYPALYEFANYTEYDLPMLAQDLETMAVETTTLQKEYDLGIYPELDASIRESSRLLQDCIDEEDINGQCNKTKAVLEALAYQANYTDIDTREAVITKVILDFWLDGAMEDVWRGVDQMKNESQKAQDEVDYVVEDVEDILEDFGLTVDDINADIMEAVDSFDIKQYQNDVNTVQKDYIDLYAEYLTIAFYCLSAFCLVVPIVIILGLGTICCAGEHGNKGEKCLKCGLLIFFIFGWLLALVTAISLLGGGLLEVMFCRHAVTYDSSMQKIEEIAKSDMSDEFINDISIYNVLHYCGRDESLYTALNLNEVEINGIDFNNLVNITEWSEKLDEEIDKITLPTNTSISIVTSEMTEAVANLTEQLKDIDFESYKIALNNTPRFAQVNSLVNELDSVGSLLLASSSNSSQSVGVKLIDEAAKINQSAFALEALNSTIENLEDAVYRAESIVQRNNMTYYLDTVEKAQNEWNDIGLGALKDALQEQGDGLVDTVNITFESLTSYIQNDFGKCKPLTDAYNLTINAVCLHFLNPFNAYWFSAGWYMSFAITAIALVTSMSMMLKGMYLHGNRVDSVPDYSDFSAPVPSSYPVKSPRKNQVHPSTSNSLNF